MEEALGEQSFRGHRRSENWVLTVPTTANLRSSVFRRVFRGVAVIRALFLAAMVSVGVVSGPVMPVAHAEAPYRNCTEARNNGDCDIPSSSDKYQTKLDRDRDGIGCEC
jgi:hypothetical protein